MPDLLQKGREWMAAQFKHHASTPITYSRGASVLEDLAATRGRSTLNIQDNEGLILQVQSDDWTIMAADLELAGDVTLPKAKDRIVQETLTMRYTFEVMTPPFEPLENGVRLQIHTKLVKTEPL